MAIGGLPAYRTPWAEWEGPDSVGELLQVIASFAPTQGEGVVWRGHASKCWGLSSTLWRLMDQPEELDFRIAEHAILQRADY